MNPAKRNRYSHVTYIGTTSPPGKAKKESAFPLREAHRHRWHSPTPVRRMRGYYITFREGSQEAFGSDLSDRYSAIISSAVNAALFASLAEEMISKSSFVSVVIALNSFTLVLTCIVFLFD